MTQENNSNNGVLSIFITVVLVWALTVVANYFLLEYKAEEIKEEVELHHAYQFWGPENYEIAKEAFSSDMFIQQQRQQLEQFLWEQWWDSVDFDQEQNSDETVEWNDNVEVEEDDWFTRWEISQEEINSILENSRIYWNESARITWLEFSDINCPFCVRQSKDWTVKQVVDNNEDINYIYKSFPIFWDKSYPWSYAIECVWDLAWNEDYYNFKEDFYALDNKEDSSSWEELAESYWLNMNEFNACVDNAEHDDIIQKNLQEWQIFDVQWTPGNVLLDTETGEWVLVPWAYPADTFEWLLENMLN